MKQIGIMLTLGASLTLSSAAQAADRTVVGVGTGAVAGAVVAGPIGAVVGAVAGGFIGANSSSGRSARRRRPRAYARRAAVSYESRPGPDTIRTGSVAPVTRGAVSEVSTAGTGGSGWRDPR